MTIKEQIGYGGLAAIIFVAVDYVLAIGISLFAHRISEGVFVIVSILAALLVAFFYYRTKPKSAKWSPLFMGLFAVILRLLVVTPSGQLGVPVLLSTTAILLLPCIVGGYLGLQFSKK